MTSEVDFYGVGIQKQRKKRKKEIEAAKEKKEKEKEIYEKKEVEIKVFVISADYYFTCWIVEMPWRYKFARTCAMNFWTFFFTFLHP